MSSPKVANPRLNYRERIHGLLFNSILVADGGGKFGVSFSRQIQHRAPQRIDLIFIPSSKAVTKAVYLAPKLALSRKNTCLTTTMSTLNSASSASAANSAVLDALELIIGEATKVVASEIEPAVDNVSASQQGLESRLRQLDAEMSSITTILDSVTLDPETSARMEETKDVLRRTRKKLTTIRGRLGRLRTYEESDRLQLSEQRLMDRRTAGRISEVLHLSTDDLWSEQPLHVQNDSDAMVDNAGPEGQ